MLIDFRFEYWIEDNWYVGYLKDVPGVFSQGETLQELEENIKDAYYMMRASSETDFLPLRWNMVGYNEFPTHPTSLHLVQRLLGMNGWILRHFNLQVIRLFRFNY